MTGFPLPTTDLAGAGLREGQIERLAALIEAHIKDGHYPGAQIAIARNGALALFRTFGNAALDRKADDRTLWLLFSNTKVVTAAALWVLAACAWPGNCLPKAWYWLGPAECWGWCWPAPH